MLLKLKASVFISFIFSILYILFLNPFEFADELHHFYRSVGDLFYKEKYYIDENIALICEINNCNEPLIEVLIKSFKINFSSESKMVVELANIKGYIFTSYIYQKFLTSILSIIIINPILIYFLGKFLILTINFILIYFILKNINNLILRSYLIFLINFPLFLISIGSYSQDMVLIILSVACIFILLRRINTFNFAIINLLILIISIGKMPYGFFYFISFLILIKKFDIKFMLIFITSIFLFILINIYNLNSFELMRRPFIDFGNNFIYEGLNKQPYITFEGHLIFLKENLIQIPILILSNFYKNTWTYVSQGVGYYSINNVINYPWNIIIYPFLLSYLLIFITFFAKNYNRKALIFVVLSVLSILFVTFIHWFGFSYPKELSNVYGLTGRYFLINIIFFSYFFNYKKNNFENLFDKKFISFIFYFSICANIINLTNLIDNKYF